MHDGLRPPGYRPRGGGGTGVTQNAKSAFVRQCPDTGEYVSEREHCPECDRWDDHGAGHPQCYYDWLYEQQEE